LDIESIVFVQCDTHPDDGLKETAWVTDLATRVEPRIQGIVAWAPLEEGEQVAPFVEKLAENPLVKGIRRLIQSESIDFCVQPDFVSGVKTLSRYGLSFDICIFHPQLANAIRLVEQCPHVQFILDHIGKPDIKNQRFDPWKQEIQALAAFPNVHCKISGLVTEADFEAWAPTDLQPYIEHVIACFGFNRVIYGSDWPVSTQASDYPRWVDTLTEAVSGCTSEELCNLFRDNAIRFYRLAE
jgi:L-fuconolactonase